MPEARAGAVSEVLANGEVLVAGGIGSGDTVLSSAVVYNPRTGRWTPTGALPFGAAYAASVRLASGKVLVAGGVGPGHAVLSETAIYDPATGNWTPAAPMLDGRSFAGSALLKSGEVLVAGGTGKSGDLASAELFDPATNTWHATASLPKAGSGLSAVTLHDGNVLVVGGGDNAYLYLPSTNSWSETGGTSAPFSFQRAVMLKDGNVLVVGGDGRHASTARAALYEPAVRRWVYAGKLAAPTSDEAIALLPDGKVLAAGGSDVSIGSSGLVTKVTGNLESELFAFPANWTGVATSGLPRLTAGSAAGYYLGTANPSASRWLMNVSNPSQHRVVYSGTVTIDLGRFVHVRGLRLARGDYVKVERGKITFRFVDAHGVAGLSFIVPPSASRLTLSLFRDGKRVPVRELYGGRAPYHHPRANPWVINRA